MLYQLSYASAAQTEKRYQKGTSIARLGNRGRAVSTSERQRIALEIELYNILAAFAQPENFVRRGAPRGRRISANLAAQTEARLARKRTKHEKIFSLQRTQGVN